MFYLLSRTENERMNSSVNVCTSRMRKGKTTVKDLHVYMKNLRGYSSYWKSCRADLLAMI